MDEAQLIDKIRAIISENTGIEKEKITLDLKIEDLCKDSIQIFSLIMAFEKAFAQKVEYEDLIHIETVRDILEFLLKRLESGAGQP